MFGRIGRRINYKEVYVIVSEQMSVLDWESCYPNEEECVRAALKIIEYIKIYGTCMVGASTHFSKINRCVL